MPFVGADHIERWFKQHPDRHRTGQQGHQIICPVKQKFGFPADELKLRPSHITRCPFCQAHLGHVEPILDKDHQGEWQWPTAA